MPASAGRVVEGRGEAESQTTRDETGLPRQDTEDAGRDLLGQVLARENMERAWKRVKANKGAAGVDGLGIAETGEVLKQTWPGIRQQLLRGRYRPQPVRRVGIPKPDGSERELGIPTVTDRLIQQALLQILQPLIDPTFSEHSYGFRPGRRARGAVLAAQRYAQQGCHIVVDVDLSKFFDRVNHDILIDRLALQTFKRRVRQLTRGNGGRSVEQVVEKLRSYLLGWKGYYGLAQTPRIWRGLDEWIRRRLRALPLKQWRRGKTIYRELLRLGASPSVERSVAALSRRWWHNSCSAIHNVLTIAYFDRLGVPRLS